MFPIVCGLKIMFVFLVEISEYEGLNQTLDKLLLEAQLHFNAYHFFFRCKIFSCHKLCMPDKSNSR